MDASAWIAAVSAAVALVAVVVAVVQARYAKAQARTAEQQTQLQEQIHRDASQPYVWADFRPDLNSGFMLDLMIKNEGPSVATDVVVTFDPPLRGSLNDYVDAQLKITSMPPGRALVWHFETGHTAFAEGSTTARRYRVTITATGPFGPVAPLTYHLDLSDYFNSAVSPLGTLHRVGEEMKQMTHEIKKVASALRQKSRG